MLAQLNSKQKSLFFNIKPTVIDKLISKNKSSIQNSLIYTNDDSDGSLSEDSEEGSSSSRESSFVEASRHVVAMPPVRRSEKVLGSKLSSRSQLKRAVGRPPGSSTGRGGSSVKVIAAKKVLENSKKGTPKKIPRDAPTVARVKRSSEDPLTSESVKRRRTSLKKENLTRTTACRSTVESDKTAVTRRKPKLLKDIKSVRTNENKSPSKSSLKFQTSTPLLNDKSSPRKFPSNIVDRWKSTGMVIRGRGRPRGSCKGSTRGSSLRGGIRRGILRSERYNTRDSQIGLMRSGRRRNCSDPNLIEGLDRVRRRKKVVVKTEKADCPSDEHSSFITTSELSFYDNDNSFKQSDDEAVNLRSVKIKVEMDDTEEATHSRDTNSNVFLSNKTKIKRAKITPSSTDDQSNSMYRRGALRVGRRGFGRGRRRLILLQEKIVSELESVRDSDCSLDSYLTEDLTNSPKSGNEDMSVSSKFRSRRHRRRGVDGMWVRRSTRSVGKNIEIEPDAVVIQELLKEKDEVDLDSDMNSSNDDVKRESEPCVQCSKEVLPVKNEPLEENIGSSKVTTLSQADLDSNVEIVEKSNETENKNVPISDSPIDELNENNDVHSDTSVNNDSCNDFTLVLDETPSKISVQSEPEVRFDVPIKLQFDSEPIASNEEVNCQASSVPENSSQIDLAADILVTEQSSDSVLIGLESESLSLSQSNNILKVEVSVENGTDENEGFNFDKENGESNVDNVKDVSEIEKIDDKLVEEEGERELISDENILSIFDSLCQSDSADKSTEEKETEPEVVVLNDNDKAMILDSINLITSEEDKLKQENVFETNQFNLPETVDNHSVNSEINLQNNSQINEQSEQGFNLSTLIEKEDIHNVDVIDNSVRENIIEDIQLREIDSSNVCESLHRKELPVNEMAMEIDLDSVDKAPESTEESSSSDSNSNLSEFISAPLETNSISVSKTNDCENILDGSNDNSSETTLKGSQDDDMEVDSLRVQNGGFSLVSAEPSNKLEEINTEPVFSESNLLKPSVEDGSEQRPSIELLSALGLQSTQNTGEEKPKRPTDSYTGTLKAVIKLNRSSDKRSGGRKIIFKQGDKLTEEDGGGDRLEYRICGTEELTTEGVPLTHLGDIPANRKVQIKVKSQFDLSNSPNIVGAAGSMETPTVADSSKEAGGKQNLIIPEKSSSFSIHPERLCTDVCSYCFGKFGSLDTPCHLAQLKNSDRQSKILAIEVHLSADSCLCDGCFRYVDRKANCPASQRSRKPAARRGPLAGTICAVQECTQPARHSVRRKWLIKLKKSIGKKLVIDMDKNPHLPFPLCSQHYYWVDYFTVCGICKKRLTRNHMYALGPEADELNQALSDDGIPVRLSDKLFLCKFCRYYSSLRLKYRDPSAMSSTHRLFLNSYRKKILQYHDIPVSESEEDGKSVEEDGGTSEALKPKKKKSKSKSLDSHEPKKTSAEKEEKSEPGNEEKSNDSQMIDYSYLDTLNIHREEPTTPTVDYSALEDFEGQVGFSNIASLLNPLEGGQGTVFPQDSQNRPRVEKPTRIQVKFGNLNIGKLSNLNIGQDSRPATATTPAPERPPYLPGERDLKLSGEFEFHGALNPSSGWERCTSTIQFDRDTKKLWHELQRPYGNQSSFLRHLIILEKHWRNGSLVMSESPNPKAVKYINSVRNRVQAYDGSKAPQIPVEKPKQPEQTITSPPPRPMSTPIKTVSAPPPLMKIGPAPNFWPSDHLRRPPPYSYMVPSSPGMRTVPNSAPPPYRFPQPKPSQMVPRPLRMPSPSPYINTGRGQQNVRPVSISYQQFKKIRLEKPPVVSLGQVTVVPKVEPLVEPPPPMSSSTDFVPLISDVRSLASSSHSTSESDWNESFRRQQQVMLKQNVAKYYTPILPKMPNSLTVTAFPKTSALIMKTSSLTIEKAPNISTKPNIALPEKPSISVFRETTPSENG